MYINFSKHSILGQSCGNWVVVCSWLSSLSPKNFHKFVLSLDLHPRQSILNFLRSFSTSLYDVLLPAVCPRSKSGAPPLIIIVTSRQTKIRNAIPFTIPSLSMVSLPCFQAHNLSKMPSYSSRMKSKPSAQIPSTDKSARRQTASTRAGRLTPQVLLGLTRLLVAPPVGDLKLKRR